MENLNRYTEVLKKHWGYSSFRPIQAEIIDSVYNDNDTLGLLPTGGGKSITFQVPALLKDGICLVVSPLIALMKDQVKNLSEKGIKAIAVHSGLQRQSASVLLDNAIFGDAKFLYLSPERLNTSVFKERIPYLNINLIAIDEAHCISQWGYDFRPSYLNIAQLREAFPDAPVLALTATATPRVVKDIQEKLQFETNNVFQKSFERNNLVYFVHHTDDKEHYLIRLLKRTTGSVIIYSRSRKGTQELSKQLNLNGFNSTFYHAGLDSHTKDNRQRAWTSNEVQIIVATNAFGMGIDKPDVRLVVHTDLPDSPENYFQEAGRAGRDGAKAFAVLLVNNKDKSKLLKRVANTYPKKEVIRRVYEALNNFFGVGYESGAGRLFEFDLMKMCTTFKLSSTQTHYAIKLLDKSTYLEYTEEPEATSRIHFAANKNEVFRFQEDNPKYTNLIKTILRSYTGLFTEYAYINEDILASRTGLNKQEVYELLVAISKSGLISYIPGKKKPTIRFLQDRCEKNLVRIPRSVYEDLKSQYEMRVNSMINYSFRSDKCRSAMLLEYFGEQNAPNCGQCDICLKKRSGKEQQSEKVRVQQQFLHALKTQDYTINELADKFLVRDVLAQEVMRLLLDSGKVTSSDGLIFSLK